MAETTTLTDNDLIDAIFDRIGRTLAMMDGHFSHEDLTVTREQTRPAGEDQIHISYKIAYRYGSEDFHGSFLLPLGETMTIAAMLMMLPQESVDEIRAADSLVPEVRDAVVELGNLIAGAVDYALRDAVGDGSSARFRGCQGVRAGVRPAFPYEEGQTLLVGRARGRIAEYDEFPFLFMMPLPPGM